MKNVLTILFFALSFPAFSQDVIRDTSFTITLSGQFYQISVITYDNGTSAPTMTALGDTGQMVARMQANILQRTEAMAGDARIIASFKRDFTTLIQKAANVSAVVGDAKGPLKRIALDQIDVLADSSYRWKIDTSTIVFSYNQNQSQAKYKLGGGALKNAVITPGVIRLQNFTPGNSIDLYRFSESKYQSIDGSVIMKRVRVGANRTFGSLYSPPIGRLSFNTLIASPMLWLSKSDPGKKEYKLWSFRSADLDIFGDGTLNRRIGGGLAAMFAAGAFRGLNQTILFHYPAFQRNFPGANDGWWNPDESWRNKYDGGDPANGAAFPGSTGIFVGVTDGYHFTSQANTLFFWGGTVMLTIGERRPIWHYGLTYLAGFLCNRVGFALTYDMIK